MNVNETPCEKLNLAQWLSVKNSYGEFYDNLKSGLIAVIRFRETGREPEKRTIRLFIHLFIIYSQFAKCESLGQVNQSTR